jgi:hypothetical protein
LPVTVTVLLPDQARAGVAVTTGVTKAADANATSAALLRIDEFLRLVLSVFISEILLHRQTKSGKPQLNQRVIGPRRLAMI